MRIKLMTYNILCGENINTHKTDHKRFAEVIKEYGADIVSLNEVRSGDALNNAPEIARLLGYEYYYAGAIFLEGNNQHGNALLSRFPIIDAKKIMIPDPPRTEDSGWYETRCILKAKVDAGKPINVMSTHFGLLRAEQENAVRTVIDNIEEKCVLMGDFNVTPDNKLIDPIRERMTDAAELFKKPLLSFPSDTPDRKIDYIFVSKDIKVISADIPGVVVSDHRPHIAEIEI